MAPLTGFFFSHKIAHFFSDNQKDNTSTSSGRRHFKSLFLINFEQILFEKAFSKLKKPLPNIGSYFAQISRAWWRVALLIHLIMMLQRLFTLPQNRSHPIIYMIHKINYNKQQWRTWCTDDRNDIATIMYVCDYFIIEPFDVKLVSILDFAHTFIHYCLFQRNCFPMIKSICALGRCWATVTTEPSTGYL